MKKRQPNALGKFLDGDGASDRIDAGFLKGFARG
jgi:hypothetical protein